ncbi:hypothetical protein ACMD2_18443 [Ananas comosus]|uniref:Uncharacterized protein n=1 Tax=Ananas comosus TaxID=4615 RepID=A0A199UMJ8_ANACO|nr:hypothetical protein ACMD2_18443 [Ananas comosus]
MLNSMSDDDAPELKSGRRRGRTRRGSRQRGQGTRMRRGSWQGGAGYPASDLKSHRTTPLFAPTDISNLTGEELPRSYLTRLTSQAIGLQLPRSNLISNELPRSILISNELPRSILIGEGLPRHSPQLTSQSNGEKKKEERERENKEIWGTWEELLLACAVSRHSARSWDSVAMEVQARSPFVHLLTPHNCRLYFCHLRRRFSDADADADPDLADAIP